MLARDDWLLKASTVEEETHVEILWVLPVIERVHLAEVVGNAGLLTIKFIGGLSQILPDTDEIVGCDESGVSDAAGTGVVFQSRCTLSTLPLLCARGKEKAAIGVGPAVLSEVSEGDTTDIVVTESPALSKGWDSHKCFNQII